MSLIPSESYSFPDHFTSTVTPSRKPKNAEREAAAIDTRRQKPSIVALPNPKPRPVASPSVIRGNSEPTSNKAAPPMPNPALRRASAPPPRIPEAPKKIAISPILKPKVSWNTRAPTMDPAPITGNGTGHVPHETLAAPAQNVIPMKPAGVARPGRMMPPPESLAPQDPVPAVATRPAPIAKGSRPAQTPAVPEHPRPSAASNPQADFFEMFAQSGETAFAKRCRKTKMRRFIVCESVAVAILLPLAILGISHRPDNAALLWIMNISTIASAVAAALIPILFFALTPTPPEIEC